MSRWSEPTRIALQLSRTRIMAASPTASTISSAARSLVIVVIREINACAVPCREAWPRGSACRLNMTADVLTMQRVAARFLSGCRNPLPCPCTDRLFNWSRSHISVPGRMNACHPSSGAVTSVLYVGCPRTFTHVQYSASRCNGTQPAKVSIRAGAHTNRRDQKEAVPWQITRSCPSSPTKS